MGVAEVFGEVSREDFGKVLPLKISNEETAYFDWTAVTISEKFLEWEEGHLRNLFRHEFGHYFFSPRDPRVGIAMDYIAKAMGFDNYHLFVNIFTDLLVDITNMRVFGEEYLRFLEWSFERGNKNQILAVMSGVYSACARDLGMETSLEGNQLGDEIYRILRSGEMDVYTKEIEVGKMMRNKVAIPSFKHFILHIFSNASPDEVARTLIELGIDINEIPRNEKTPFINLGGMFRERADPVTVEYRKMMILARYMEVEREYGSITGREENFGQWSIGDPPETLDFQRTLSTYGTVLPGIYSIRKVEEDRGNSRSGRYKDSVIVVDFSGSMNGEPAQRAREAAYAIARKTIESGGRAALIPFSTGTEESFVVEPTKDTHRILTTLATIDADGGTEVHKALRRAMDFGNKFHLYLITDAEVSDENWASSTLEHFKGRATVFIVSDEVDRNGWFWKNGVWVIQITPDGLVREAYRGWRKRR